MWLRKYGLYFVWLLASIGSLISLYFSDVRHVAPCHLCWYQRIALFPLVIMVGIAAYRGFLGIAIYVIWQVLIGFILSLYQILIQEIPGWNPIELCGAGPSCGDKLYIFGSVTLPMGAAALFLILSVLLFALWITDNRQNVQDNH